MKRKTVQLTLEQEQRIATAICGALTDGPLRAGQLERHPKVVPVLATLPRGKSYMRHIDSALQRLRRIDAIKYTSNGWRVRQ